MSRKAATLSLKTSVTKFTEAHAKAIAEVSFRAGRDEHKPLSGLHSELLRALIEAEQAHESALTEWLVKHKAYLKDVQVIKVHEAFYKHFGRAIEAWEAMDNFAKDDLLAYTQNHLEMIEERQGRIPFEVVQKRCDDTLTAIARAAREKVTRRAGQTSGKSQSVGHANQTERPLYAFVAALQSFWKTNVASQHFAQQFQGDVPLSAAAKMVVEAAKHLHVQYSPGNIKTVMRMLCANPPKKFSDDALAFILPRFED